MEWKNIKVPPGAKLFKSHTFTFMVKGSTYHLEIDEYSDGSFTGHGEHSADRNTFVESVSGRTLNECLVGLIERIQGRHT
ncbi:MAG: hypothetical protein RIQ81_838 [Pseudomonadota bacterium]